jgi:F-type H+-transporting ATPase subunit delta
VQLITVAKRYARALADAAGDGDRDRLERLAADLSLAADVVGRDPRLLRFFADPSVPAPHKEAVVEALAKKGKTAELSRKFLAVLIARRRLAALPAIARAFEKIKDERCGVVAVETTTAVPLSAAEVKRLRESLQEMTGLQVRLTVSVDPAVIGGARTRIGSRVYDGTLRRQLAILRDRLAAAR